MKILNSQRFYETSAFPSMHVSYYSVIPWLSFTQSFCSLSDRTVTLVGGGLSGLLYTLCAPDRSSRLNLQHRIKHFTSACCLMPSPIQRGGVHWTDPGKYALLFASQRHCLIVYSTFTISPQNLIFRSDRPLIKLFFYEMAAKTSRYQT